MRLLPLLSSHCTNNRFPQMTGEPWPLPGNATFQLKSFEVHLVGIVVALLMPLPFVDASAASSSG